jgi:hypothetical protein
MTNLQEIWVNAYKYEDYYEVSNLGNIRNKKTKKVLKGSYNTYGYHQFTASIKGRYTTISSHRIIMNSFFGEHPNLQVNHINGNKKDNNLKNLEWCTNIENIRHSIKLGLVKKQQTGVFARDADIYLHKEYGLFIAYKEFCRLHKIPPSKNIVLKKMGNKYILT